MTLAVGKSETTSQDEQATTSAASELLRIWERNINLLAQGKKAASEKSNDGR